METHIRAVHYGDRPWQCQHCTWSFKTKMVLLRHVATQHKANKKFRYYFCHCYFIHTFFILFFISCRQCPNTYSREDKLKKHVVDCHKAQKRKYKSHKFVHGPDGDSGDDFV